MGLECCGSFAAKVGVEASSGCEFRFPIYPAEIPVGGIHMDYILPDYSLPLKYVAYSHCFGTEVGAAGSATRGRFSFVER